MPADAAVITDDQRKLLRLVYDFFGSNRQWPTRRWLNQVAFVQYALEFDELYAGLPSGMVLPDPHTARISPGPDNPISLALRGLIALDETDDLNVLLKTVRYLGKEAASYIPATESSVELIVDSLRVAAAIGREATDSSLTLAREMIVQSLWEMWAGASVAEDGSWTISLVPEKARAYRDVESIDDVLKAHAPYEPAQAAWARAVSMPQLDELEPSNGEDGAELGASDTEEVPHNTVFVVYGRNEPARAAMFDFLASLGLEPLTWEKLLATTGDGAPYVGQVLTAGFRVAQAVVVLLTPDDEARLRPAFHRDRDPAYEKEYTHQARPNVLFEAGMALVSHEHRTVIVELGELRPFSDVAGRNTIRMNDSVEKRQALASRLDTAGCSVDLSGNWREAGHFAAALEVGPGDGDEAATVSPRQAHFALQAENVESGLKAGPVTLRVENYGPSDEFEATVVAVQGSHDARPPWEVRWRNGNAALLLICARGRGQAPGCAGLGGELR